MRKRRDTLGPLVYRIFAAENSLPFLFSFALALSLVEKKEMYLDRISDIHSCIRI